MKEQHRRNDPDPDFFRAKTPRLRFSPPPCYSVALLLAADGIWSIVGGVRTLSNKSPDIEHDSESEKRLLSPYTRYWISRWYNGFDYLQAGIGFLLFAALLHFAKW